MNRLQELRIERRLSQSELSKLSGVSLKMIQSYEQGVKDLTKAQVGTVYKLSKALSCKMESLLGLLPVDKKIDLSCFKNASHLVDFLNENRYVITKIQVDCRVGGDITYIKKVQGYCDDFIDQLGQEWDFGYVTGNVLSFWNEGIRDYVITVYYKDKDIE